jgi:Coenzyme PQQ synthesis protein D (PqqD)
VEPLKEERFRIAGHVHARRFDDEVVVLDLGAGEYYSLDAVGAAIWEQLKGGRSAEEIVEFLLATYEVDEPTARADALRIIEDLLAARLVERKD